MWLCEVWMVSRNGLKMDLATWRLILEDWDINIDSCYFTAITYAQ